MRQLSIPLSSQAYARLKGLILTGEVASGDALSERRLAERLELGRMPVREAVRDLVKDGLVESLPGRGMVVRRLSFEELRDVYEARQAVAGMATFLAAKRGATPELRGFRGRFETLLAAPGIDPREAQRSGHSFHLAIARAARNGELARILEGLQAKVGLLLTTEESPGRISASLREHAGILDAIEAGAAAEARRRMLAHLTRSLEARIHIHERVA